MILGQLPIGVIPLGSIESTTAFAPLGVFTVSGGLVLGGTAIYVVTVKLVLTVSGGFVVGSHINPFLFTGVGTWEFIATAQEEHAFTLTDTTKLFIMTET